jgi:hypothetical protein
LTDMDAELTPVKPASSRVPFAPRNRSCGLPCGSC